MVLAGVAVHAPLSRVPENQLKFGVGVMLTSFGMFWGAEGAGAHWPGGDAALLAIIPLTLAGGAGDGGRGAASAAPEWPKRPTTSRRCTHERVGSLLRFVWEFVVGDDWRIAVGVVLALALTALVAGAGVAAWWILPLAAAGLLAASVWRAGRGGPAEAPRAAAGRGRVAPRALTGPSVGMRPGPSVAVARPWS